MNLTNVCHTLGVPCEAKSSTCSSSRGRQTACFHARRNAERARPHPTNAGSADGWAPSDAYASPWTALERFFLRTTLTLDPSARTEFNTASASTAAPAPSTPDVCLTRTYAAASVRRRKQRSFCLSTWLLASEIASAASCRLGNTLQDGWWSTRSAQAGHTERDDTAGAASSDTITERVF